MQLCLKLELKFKNAQSLNFTWSYNANTFFLMLYGYIQQCFLHE